MQKLKQFFKSHEEVITYIIAGVMTTVVCYLTRLIIRPFMPMLVAIVIANVAAITFAYIVNKIWVFKSKTKNFRELIKEAVKFYAARVFSIVLDLLIAYVFVEQFGWWFIKILGLNNIDYNSAFFNIKILGFDFASRFGTPELFEEQIFFFIAQVLIMILNYILSKLIVFRKKKSETNL